MHIPYQEHDVTITDAGAFVGTVNTKQFKRPLANTVVTNPCSEINLSAVATTYIGTDFIELAGKHFSSKQVAYLLSKLLEEHPECQV